MKRIYLLRHAKSSWADPSLKDYERPLNKRGRQAAPGVGKLLKKRGWLPGFVLCSPATRAEETWSLVAAELKAPPQVKLLKTLYQATPSQLLRALRRTPAESESVLLVGHNPAIETLAIQLAGPGSKAKALARLRAKYPTAALAVFDFDAESWADLGTELAHGHCILSDFVVPRDLD